MGMRRFRRLACAQYRSTTNRRREQLFPVRCSFRWRRRKRTEEEPIQSTENLRWSLENSYARPMKEGGHLRTRTTKSASVGNPSMKPTTQFDLYTPKVNLSRSFQYWVSRAPGLVDAYLAYMQSEKPDTSKAFWDGGSSFKGPGRLQQTLAIDESRKTESRLIKVVDLFEPFRSCSIDYKHGDEDYMSSFVRCGIVPCAPVRLTVGITIRTLKFFNDASMGHSRTSMRAFVGMICGLHQIPYKRFYRKLFHAAFSGYLMILVTTDCANTLKFRTGLDPPDPPPPYLPPRNELSVSPFRSSEPSQLISIDEPEGRPRNEIDELTTKGGAEGVSEHFESFSLDVYNLKVHEVAKAEQYSPASATPISENEVTLKTEAVAEICSTKNARRTESVRVECARRIRTGLHEMVSGEPKMNYSKYESYIVARYGVDLVGWPAGIRFTSPSFLTKIDDLRCLRDSLANGATRWIKLSAEEWDIRKQAVHKQDLQKPLAPRPAKRKTSTADTSNESAITPAKRMRPTAARPRNRRVTKVSPPAIQKSQDVDGDHTVAVPPLMYSLRDTPLTGNFGFNQSFGHPQPGFSHLMDVDATTSIMEPLNFQQITIDSATEDVSPGIFAIPHQPVWTDTALAQFVNEIFDTTTFAFPPTCVPQTPVVHNGFQDFNMLS